MTHQRTFPALFRTSKQIVQLQAANRRGVNLVTRRLAISHLNNPAIKEVAARALTMVDARMAQSQLKARGSHRTNGKGKASHEAAADMNRRTDEVVVKAVKANDRMVTKVSEVVVLRARQLNSLLTVHFQVYGDGGV